jgi:hypothetical protein
MKPGDSIANACAACVADSSSCHLESRVVNQLFGVATGLGMGVLTFDWTQILYVGSPLMVPWWVQAHAIVGFVVFYWIVCPILYYRNVSL